MNRKVLVISGLLLLGGAGWGGEVEWVKDFNSALQLAQKGHKKLLIDFFSPT